MSDELVSLGKRSLVCGEIPQAVESLQKACTMLSCEHGDLDDCLAEPNLLYGTALLELARMEGTVIGYALDGVPEDSQSSESDNELVEKGPEMSAEEKEDLSNQIIDAMCEEVPAKEEDVKNETDPEPAGDQESGKDESADDAEGDPEEDEGDDGNDEKEPSEPDVKEDIQQDDEEVTNLQLAWEVIEVAKQIFSRKDDDQSKLKVAECLEKLAEISREKEDYSQALNDLQECLKTRLAILPDDHREVAETHFQIGATHAVAGTLDLASCSYKKAVECLQRHVENLKEQISVLDASNENADELCTFRTSLKEVESLIPDVQRRLSEVEEDLMASKFTAGPSNTHESKPEELDSSKPAGDITHLIRKKRHVEDELVKTGVDNDVLTHNGNTSPDSRKKVKLDEVVTNGSSEHLNGLPKSDNVNGAQDYPVTEVV